ncbi:MAG: MarR family transcriptional regulator [Chromatiales bacterium]|nr:MarR family transcriptional regulator [Chromatiales bacterium]
MKPSLVRPHADEDHAQSIVRRLRILFRAIQDGSRRIEKVCGVSSAQLWALWELDGSPGLSVGDLSERLSIHPSTASNMLDKLERKRLIERRRTGSDQRVVRLFLTGEGAALVKSAPQPARGGVNEALTRLPPQILADLDRGLADLLAAMGDRADEAAALRPLADEA